MQSKHKRHKPTWKWFRSWDWSAKNITLAEQHGYGLSQVGRIRKRLGIGKYSYKLRERLRSWDWSEQDVTLAEQHGYCQSAVGRIRTRLGKEKSPKHHDCRTGKLRGRRSMAAWEEQDWGRNDTEIAVMIGCTSSGVAYQRRRLGMANPSRYKHRPKS